MKKTKTPVYLLFFALSLTFVLADCGIVENVFSHISIKYESTNSVCFEDEVFMNESKEILNNFTVKNGLTSVLNSSLLSSYFSSIWQPPKLG